MASNIYLQSGGVSYYLSGTNRTDYSGSGTPWTSQSTTPYTIGNSDEPYTPQVPQASLVFGGGPPFRSGQSLHYRNFPNVTETITIQCYGSTYDNAVALKQKLYQILHSTVTGHPCRLIVQPNGSTNIGATEIYSADIQEDPRFINSERASFVARLKVTWVRAPFFAVGPSDSDETIISNVSFNNTGTGSPDNVDAFTSFSGELQNEGQPTIVTVVPSGAGPFTIFYLSTIQSRTYSTTGAAALSTSSTTGTQTALNAPTITNAMTALGVKARCLMRFTNNTSNVQIRVEVRANTSGTLLYAGKWITPTSGSATLYDMGEIPLDVFRKGFPGTSTLQLYIGYRSTNGSSATTTLGYNEFLLYYDFCRVDTNISSSGSNTHLRLYSYPVTTRLFLPYAAPIAVATNSSSAIFDDATVRGTFPRAINGASFYVAWMQANNVHATTDGASVSVRQAPLYLTLRGGL